MLWEFAAGRDTRAVEPPKARKSVGAEVNWGVRCWGGECSLVLQLSASIGWRGFPVGPVSWGGGVAGYEWPVLRGAGLLMHSLATSKGFLKV